MVINILNGANTLWQAYATTNVLASVATLESVTFELTPIFWRAAWTSIPLDQEKQNDMNLVKKWNFACWAVYLDFFGGE